MSRRVLFAAPVLAALFALPIARARDVPGDGSPSARMAVPPLSEEGLPPLPPQSPRNASYTIQARLDDVRHHIDGRLLLEWTNTTIANALTRSE